MWSRNVKIALCVFAWVQIAAPAMASQPRLEDVHREVLRFAGLDGPSDRWSGRARASNLLPQISATYGWFAQNQRQNRLRENFDQFEGVPLSDDLQSIWVDDWRQRDHFTIRATISPGRLIYDPSEAIAAREERARIELRRLLLREATEHFMHRQRLLRQLELQEADLSLEEILEITFDIERTTAHLNALTGGWFSRRINGGDRR